MALGPWQRRRFRDVVRRQLDLFEGEHEALVRAAREELANYGVEHDPDTAQLHYADHDWLSAEVDDRLYQMRDLYSESIDPARVQWYRQEFDRQARRRLGDLLPRLHYRYRDGSDGS